MIDAANVVGVVIKPGEQLDYTVGAQGLYSRSTEAYSYMNITFPLVYWQGLFLIYRGHLVGSPIYMYTVKSKCS